MANNNNIDLGLIVALIKKLGGSAGDINKQIADYINAHTNVAGGIAGLDDASQIAPAQLPDRNHQLVLPYIVELTSNEMANAIDAGTEDYGTIAVGQLATPTTNDVFVVGHLYQYVSEEGVYNWNDVTESIEINPLTLPTLPLGRVKIGQTTYGTSYLIDLGTIYINTEEELQKLESGTISSILTQEQWGLLLNGVSTIHVSFELSEELWNTFKNITYAPRTVNLYLTHYSTEYSDRGLLITYAGTQVDAFTPGSDEEVSYFGQLGFQISDISFYDSENNQYFIGGTLVNYFSQGANDIHSAYDETANEDDFFAVSGRAVADKIPYFYPISIEHNTFNFYSKHTKEVYNRLQDTAYDKQLMTLTFTLPNIDYNIQAYYTPTTALHKWYAFVEGTNYWFTITNLTETEVSGTYTTTSIKPLGASVFQKYGTIESSMFSPDTTYESSGFYYKATVPMEGVLSTDQVDVTLDMASAMSGIYSPITEAYEGGYYIWAKELPSNTTVTQCVIIRGGNL